MFNFLKDKIKSAISGFSKKIEEGTEEQTEEQREEDKIVEEREEDIYEEKGRDKLVEDAEITPAEEGFVEGYEKAEKPVPRKVKEKEREKQVEEEKEEEPKEYVEPKKGFFGLPKKSFGFLGFKKKEEKPSEEKEVKETTKAEEEKKGIFKKIKQTITTKKINEGQFNTLFWDLEIALLENNVAVDVIEKIKKDLKVNLVEKPLARTRTEQVIKDTLRDSINEILEIEKIDLIEKIKSKKPFVVCFVGINGSGKTTTIAKVAKMLKDRGFSCVMAAADTFRAASIEQLQEHADNLDIKLIKHDYGADPAAVAFDAIKHAEAKDIDIVLIDTAGRMHSNVNLIDEMKKIIRVAKPDLKIFVGEAITGNDCIEQAKKFDEAITIDAIILSKLDVDEKGGAALSVSYVTKKPIIYVGMGQEYEDLKEFDSSMVLDNLGLS
ncbi:MAG: signal recognition particle-docking protein FtsY [Nanoarchaeota archaeon]|nr:signal recognition particle-docking protein FtsY [Nanoarchaeota archaeon]